MPSEAVEQIWLKFYTGMEICPGHCIPHVNGDRPRGPTSAPGEPKIYHGEILHQSCTEQLDVYVL